MSASSHGRVRTRPGFLDPAWLFLIAGIGAIGACVLIPAGESLDEARYRREVALTWEAERLERLARHEAYLSSVLEREPATIRQLRAIQLNQYPAGMEPLSEAQVDPGLASASVFAMLEPEPHMPPMPPKTGDDRSRLARWATGDRSRLWLLAGGAVCVLIGLLPASGATPSRPRRATHGWDDRDATVTA